MVASDDSFPFEKMVPFQGRHSPTFFFLGGVKKCVFLFNLRNINGRSFSSNHATSMARLQVRLKASKKVAEDRHRQRDSHDVWKRKMGTSQKKNETGIVSCGFSCWFWQNIFLGINIKPMLSPE